MDTASNIGRDLVDLVFGIVQLILLLRLLLQLFRADFYNPVSQAVVRSTAWLDPLRRVMGQAGGIDIATFVAILTALMLQIAITTKLVFGGYPAIPGLVAGSALGLLDLLLTFFFWSILFTVVISWVAPQGHNPLASLAYSLTEPLLGPARRLLPPMGGLDFSPMIVLFLLHVLRSYGMPALAQLLRPLFG